MTVDKGALPLTAEELGGLFDQLEIEDDELCVLSLAGPEFGAKGPEAQLAFASVLFCPPAIADLSWPEWSSQGDPAMRVLLQQWKDLGLDSHEWISFSDARLGWQFIRAVLPRGSVNIVVTWLAELLAGNVSPVPGTHGVAVRMSARPASALIRTMQHLASPASLFTLRAGRPVTGYLFPLDFGPATAPPLDWDFSGAVIPNAPLWMLGLPLSDPPLHAVAFDPNALPEPGLFLGRLERAAWITDLRAEPDAETFRVGFGIDESRIALADLEVSLEEYFQGDLVAARRIRLGDIPLPAAPIPEGHEVAFNMPTVGPGVFRLLRLYDRDGRLLDTTDRFPVVEQINLDVGMAGAPVHQAQIGKAQQLGLFERLERAEVAHEAYRQLLAAGLEGRIIDDPANGALVLMAALQAALEEVKVLDPYFGWKLQDWRVFDTTTVPVKVLTGHGRYRPDGTLQRQEVKPPAAGTAPAAPSLEARSWRSGIPPWHDRLYLWTGGGLSVGTSPSGLGRRLARLDRLSGTESQGWQALFDTWWVSADVAAV